MVVRADATNELAALVTVAGLVFLVAYSSQSWDAWDAVVGLFAAVFGVVYHRRLWHRTECVAITGLLLFFAATLAGVIFIGGVVAFGAGVFGVFLEMKRFPLILQDPSPGQWQSVVLPIGYLLFEASYASAVVRKHRRHRDNSE